MALNLKHLYEGSTRNVFKSVLLGKAAAGVTLDVNLESEPPDVSQGLRVISTTPRMAPHPLASHPRVAPDQRKAVARAVLAMWKRPDGAKLLRAVRLTEPVPADYDADYRHLEAVDIEGLSAAGGE